jgi:hypothetical protein
MTTPIRSRQPAPAVAGSAPSTRTSPALRLRSPAMISTTVVLPAPFGPSSAKISPRAISSATSRTASRDP